MLSNKWRGQQGASSLEAWPQPQRPELTRLLSNRLGLRSISAIFWFTWWTEPMRQAVRAWAKEALWAVVARQQDGASLARVQAHSLPP